MLRGDEDAERASAHEAKPHEATANPLDVLGPTSVLTSGYLYSRFNLHHTSIFPPCTTTYPPHYINTTIIQSSHLLSPHILSVLVKPTLS